MEDFISSWAASTQHCVILEIIYIFSYYGLDDIEDIESEKEYINNTVITEERGVKSGKSEEKLNI